MRKRAKERPVDKKTDKVQNQVQNENQAEQEQTQDHEEEEEQQEEQLEKGESTCKSCGGVVFKELKCCCGHYFHPPPQYVKHKKRQGRCMEEMVANGIPEKELCLLREENKLLRKLADELLAAKRDQETMNYVIHENNKLLKYKLKHMTKRIHSEGTCSSKCHSANICTCASDGCSENSGGHVAVGCGPGATGIFGGNGNFTPGGPFAFRPGDIGIDGMSNLGSYGLGGFAQGGIGPSGLVVEGIGTGYGGNVGYGPGGIGGFGPGGSPDFGPGGSADFGPGGSADFGPGGPAGFGPRGTATFGPGGAASLGTTGSGPGGAAGLNPGGAAVLKPGGSAGFGPRGTVVYGPGGTGPNRTGSFRRGGSEAGSLGPRGTGSIGAKNKQSGSGLNRSRSNNGKSGPGGNTPQAVVSFYNASLSELGKSISEDESIESMDNPNDLPPQATKGNLVNQRGQKSPKKERSELTNSASKNSEISKTKSNNRYTGPMMPLSTQQSYLMNRKIE